MMHSLCQRNPCSFSLISKVQPGLSGFLAHPTFVTNLSKFLIPYSMQQIKDTSANDGYFLLEVLSCFKRELSSPLSLWPRFLYPSLPMHSFLFLDQPRLFGCPLPLD